MKRCVKIRGVEFQAIPATGQIRLPDYRIWLLETEVIVEIKQLERGDFERELLASAEEPELHIRA